MSFSMLAQVKQVSKTIKACKYFDFFVPAPYSGVPMRAGHMLEISYSSKDGRYGIDYKLGDKRVMVSCRYDSQLSDGRYRYAGIEINSMRETQVITKEKLNKFLEYYGQEQLSTFEDDKSICVEMAYMGPLYIYPLKNTPELLVSIEKKRNEISVQTKFDNLYSYWKSIRFRMQDSLRTELVKEFFENKGKIKCIENGKINQNVNYTICIDSNKLVKTICMNDLILDKELYNELNSNNDKYEVRNRDGAKLINGKLFYSTYFTPNFKIRVFHGQVVVMGGKYSYDISISAKSKEIIESKIQKKGQYILEVEELDGKPIVLKSKKKPWAYVNLPEPVTIYSIYE